jgi:hypothetical protein
MTYIWLAIMFMALVAAVGVMLGNYIRDMRYLKKKTSEAFGAKLKEEIEAEREGGRRRHEKFEKAFEDAKRFNAEGTKPY